MSNTLGASLEIKVSASTIKNFSILVLFV